MSDIRTGYDPNFLEGHQVNLPKAGLELEDDIFTSEKLREGCIADYIHYSAVMSKFNNQALFSAANLDQKLLQTVSGRNWFVDPRIGLENQVGPKAYKSNPWDRGHLTRRTAVTWGTKYVAKRASNDSCSYANASMQHENFNQDEWRVPEEIVSHLDRDKDGKITIFTGPVFTQTDRWYTKRTLNESVRIPGGFWKVVVYVGKESKKLECQAFILYQDANFLLDKRGRHKLDIRNYQVTITEIENLTGLEFDEALFNANPLYFFPRDNINEGPEGFRTPKSTKPSELDKGLVFNRKDAESDQFKSRKRNIKEDEFEDFVSRIRDV